MELKDSMVNHSMENITQWTNCMDNWIGRRLTNIKYLSERITKRGSGELIRVGMVRFATQQQIVGCVPAQQIKGGVL
jgi:hypothetical protein